jgi:hypothetical protein
VSKPSPKNNIKRNEKQRDPTASIAGATPALMACDARDFLLGSSQFTILGHRRAIRYEDKSNLTIYYMGDSNSSKPAKKPAAKTKIFCLFQFFCNSSRFFLLEGSEDTPQPNNGFQPTKQYRS